LPSSSLAPKADDVTPQRLGADGPGRAPRRRRSGLGPGFDLPDAM